MINENSDNSLKEYFVWDRTTRWFHWINVICILLLTVIGTIILYAGVIEVGADGKVLLKTVHVLVGYIFFANLTWRLVWAFIGSDNSRWGALLPIGTGYRSRLAVYLSGLKDGSTPSYLGHNPLGRLMIALLLMLLAIQGATGLVLAGTDIYYPPFGGQIAEWVTDGDPQKMASLKPGSKEFVDPDKYTEMRSFRKPVITTHLYTFYMLMFAVLLHIAAVVFTEVKLRNGIVTAMFTGWKVMREPPVDKQAGE